MRSSRIVAMGALTSRVALDAPVVVELRGVEPLTSAMRMQRSSQLSYSPRNNRISLTAEEKMSNSPGVARRAKSGSPNEKILSYRSPNTNSLRNDLSQSFL